MANSTKVIKINETTKEKMIKFYADKMRDNTPKYAIFQAKDGDTTITLYSSLKVVFQGLDADIDANMWQEINNGMDIDDFTEDVKTNSNSDNKEIPININSIGSDEVGTGDYFGPIIVTASYVSKENIDFLVDLGVRDSKKISDETILKIVPKIIKKIPYKSIILSNNQYNKFHNKDMNMNKIKAVLHNKVLCELIKENNFDYDYIVIDQFEPETSFYKHLGNAKDVIKNVTFITKAEDKCLSVAVSSLISRYLFIKKMEELGDKYGMFLPKGSSSYADDVAIKLVQKYGVDVLRDVAKLNFSNTSRVIKFK